MGKEQEKKTYWEQFKDWCKARPKWCKDHLPEISIVFIIGICLGAYFLWMHGRRVSYEPTTACIVDSIRHYPPVVRGGSIDIKCVIRNTNDSCSLVITDIQPANQSIELVSGEPKIILPKDSAIVGFVFNTDKIVGYTQQKIRFYGNIKGRRDGMMELVFDTHVVRPAGDQSDYEDVYFEGKQDFADIIVDGELGEKGYTTDDPNKRIH